MNWEKRILHLGLGRFHRAHQAVYYQKLADQGDKRWGVVSMSMRSAEASDHMKEVGLKYPVIETGKTQEMTWIESIREVHAASDELENVLEVFTRPEIEIISLTITEKGYDLNSSGHLDKSKPSIASDLKQPKNPKSAIGILSRGLQLRREKQLPGVTVMSCDNLRENGHKLQQAVLMYLRELNQSDDIDWVQKNVTFPNTMVDRIVPALKEDKIQAFEKEWKLPSHSQVIATETFAQWVIEDRFVQTRPPLEKVGVEFVGDVRPYEELKLKLLNASHSFLAYAGQNRGYHFVHEAIRDEELRNAVLKLYQEVTPTLTVPAGFDVVGYQNKLIKRFENTYLPHQLKQIGMDGSQKLPQRIFPTLDLTLERSLSNEVLLQALNEWILYVWNQTKEGKVLEDPIAPLLQNISIQDRETWVKKIFQLDMFRSLTHLDRIQDRIQI